MSYNRFNQQGEFFYFIPTIQIRNQTVEFVMMALPINLHIRHQFGIQSAITNG